MVGKTRTAIPQGPSVVGMVHPPVDGGAHIPRIRHTFNSGEQTLLIGGRRLQVDWLDVTANTMYEFHGCLWYGCPRCYPGSMNKTTRAHPDRTKQEVYQATCAKETSLRKAGYTVVLEWKCDWDRRLQVEADLQAFLQGHTFHVPSLNPHDAFFGGSSLLRRGLFVLWGGWGERKRERAGHDGKRHERREASAPAFFLFPSLPARFLFFRLLLFIGIPSESLCGGESGGRTNACQLCAEAGVNQGEEIRYVDVTSLYPTVKKFDTFPVKHPQIITQPVQDIHRYFGNPYCTVVLPMYLYHPVLPYRCGGKVTFPLCRQCVVELPKPVTVSLQTYTDPAPSGPFAAPGVPRSL